MALSERMWVIMKNRERERNTGKETDRETEREREGERERKTGLYFSWAPRYIHIHTEIQLISWTLATIHSPFVSHNTLSVVMALGRVAPPCLL